MAKWGEGDPRWIVEERADAKNVNNWHWSEKNAAKWSQETIKNLLKEIKLEDDEHSVKITGVPKCDGEADVSIRKGKLICFYEWQIEGEWSGKFKTDTKKPNCTGRVEILKLSEDYTIDELDINVSCSSSTPSADEMKLFVKKAIVAPIKEKLGKYVKLLRDEYGKDLILPTKDNSKSTASSGVPINAVEAKRLPNNIELSANKPKDCTMKEISLRDEFFCTPDDLYKVLTTCEFVQAFTRGPATVEPEKGGVYSVYGGNITGVFQSLTPGKSIEMLWRKREWPSDHNSSLKIELSSFEGGTRLALTQTNVPQYDVENTTNGWLSIYFASIKQIFGYNHRPL